MNSDLWLLLLGDDIYMVILVIVLLSDRISLCILVPKADLSYRMCTDLQKLNYVSKTDTFPIPRIEDCIDRGSTKFVSKFDLLKGFFQVPLAERGKEVCAFVICQGLLQYKVMPCGMKNSQLLSSC